MNQDIKTPSLQYFRSNENIARKWLYLVLACFCLLLTIGFGAYKLPDANVNRNATPRTPGKRASEDVEAFFAVAGTTFFTAAARGAFIVAKAACNEAAIAAILALNWAGASVCIGAYAVGALCSAIAAGIAAIGANHGWQWWKGSGTAERTFEVSHYMPVLNNTLYGGIGHTYDQYEVLESILGSTVSDLTHIAVIYPNISGIIKRDTEDLMVTWTSNFTGWPITTFCHNDYLADTAKEYMNVFANASYITKRDGGEWASFNTYGLNTDTAHIVTDNMNAEADAVFQGIGNKLTVQIQPCSDDRCYGTYSKACLAAGQSSNMGQDSDIVGELYFNAYGGIDSECDSF
jgi:hypothetical protein